MVVKLAALCSKPRPIRTSCSFILVSREASSMSKGRLVRCELGRRVLSCNDRRETKALNAS